MQQMPMQRNAQSEMERELDGLVDAGLRQAAKARPAPPPPSPPASSDGPPAVEMWGPTTTRETSPLQLLAQVADNTSKLQLLLDALLRDLTGEAPAPKRLRPEPGRIGLLPAISMIAHQIAEAHTDLAKVIQHMRKQIGGK